MTDLEATAREGPLSHNQLRLWFLDQVSPQQALYNISVRYKITGALHMDALRDSLTALVERHQVLRTSYQQHVGAPYVRVDPAQPVEITVSPPESADRTEEWLRAEARKPFDLTRAPLLRAMIASRPGDVHDLVVTVHHIAADAWSLGILDDELWTGYQAAHDGQRWSPEPLRLQYHDYARSQHERLNDGTLDAQRRYWAEQLSGTPYVEMPSDRPPGTSSEAPSTNLDRELPLEVVTALETFARSRHASLFTVLHAALSALLHHYTGSTDIITGTATAGRETDAQAAMMGFLVNLLALRVPVRGAMPFCELADVTRDALFGALANSEVPFDVVVDDLNPPRTLGRNPLFDVSIQLLYADAEPRRLSDAVVEHAPMIGAGSTWFDVMLDVRRSRTGASISFGYNAARFDEPRMRRFLDAYVAILKRVATDPEVLVRDLILAPDRPVLVSASPAPADDFDDVCATIRAHAAATPDAEAVRHAGRSLSYAQLAARADELAVRLQAAGVRPGDRVGLHLGNCAELVVAMLGVLGAGAAYVPLPVESPVARRRNLATIAGIGTIVALDPADVPDELTARVVTVTRPAAPAPAPLSPSARRPRAGELAYTLFTSGSTGTPKGVDVSHANLRVIAETGATALAITPQTRVMQLAAPVFDASVLEIFAALHAGATLCVVPPAARMRPELLAEFLCAEQVQVAFFTPALLSLAKPRQFPKLRMLAVGGEAYGPDLVNAWRERTDRFANAYGPTETTAISLKYECPADRLDQTPPIGSPLPGEYAVVLDGYGRRAPVGVAGELAVGGAGVTQGYLGDPGLTAARFVASPYGAPGERMYRTGDLCVELEDGTFRYLGRTDDQVKLRGHRISLMEVEVAVEAVAGIDQAAVVVDAAGSAADRRLVAFVTLSDSTHPLDDVTLRREVATSLPAYMVPATFIPLDRLPTTTSGKVDRRALTQRAGRTTPTHARAAGPGAGDPTAARVAALVGRQLRRADVAPDASFFDLGGNSLQLAALGSQLRAEFGVRIGAHDLLISQSVTQISALISRRAGDADDTASARGDPWRDLRGPAGGTPIVLVHDGSGSLFPYREVSQALSASHPVYGLDGTGAGETGLTVETLARRYLEVTRHNIGDEPVILLGWSFGGLVGYEMAREAPKYGLRCTGLTLVDAVHPCDRSREAADDPIEPLYFAHLRGSGLLPPSARWPDGVADVKPVDRLLAAIKAAGTDPRQWPREELQTRLKDFAAFVRAAAAYRPAGAAGPPRVQLIVPSERGDVSAWMRTLGSAVTVHRLPGDHFSLLRGDTALRIAEFATAEPRQ